MCAVIGYNRNLQVTNTTKRSTFQVNKRDHKIYLRDKQNLETRLARKQYQDQPDTMFKDSNIRYQIAERTRAIGFGGIGAFIGNARGCRQGFVPEGIRCNQAGGIGILSCQFSWRMSIPVLGCPPYCF